MKTLSYIEHLKKLADVYREMANWHHNQFMLAVERNTQVIKLYMDLEDKINGVE